MITTNGMFILDDIEGHGDSQKYSGIPGGAGAYAALGAAICSIENSDFHWIVDEGYDFPEEVRRQLQNWPVATHFRVNEGETTRGLNYYPNKNDKNKDQDLRLFKFLTPKIQINVKDWVDIYGFKLVKNKLSCIHLVCSASRCASILNDLSGIKSEKYTVVWEPLPSSCDYEHSQEFKELLERRC